MKRKTFAIAMAIIFLIACTDKQSKVVMFEYGAHSDTPCAILQGKVYQINESHNSKDSMLPLSNVMVSSHDSAKKIYKTTNTDANGNFTMSFFYNGEYDLELTKNGYKPLKMTNFIADSGQASTVQIIMEKDKGLF
jgi:Carboxypeptidase regulatory-like domain